MNEQKKAADQSVRSSFSVRIAEPGKVKLPPSVRSVGRFGM